MAVTLPFKSNQRQPRVQTVEEAFNLGMNYTNTPLAEGYQKVLVNYDVKDKGNALRPRSGLRVNEMGMFPVNCSPITYDDAYLSGVGKDCVEADNTYYRQLILSKSTSTPKANTKLYLGSAEVLTIDTDATALDYIPDVVIKPMSHDALSTGELYFNRPVAAEIHGMQLSNLSYIARHVGTFAYNNGYYYFTGSQNLKYTKLVNGKYSPQIVDVKHLTPKEAVMWGYNMLEANPYYFNNTEAVALQLFGMLPYDASNNIVMSPQTNQTVDLVCFYAAPKADTYKFVWEWKEPGATDWTTLKTETIPMTNLPVAKASFSSPLSSVMVRVSAYKSTGPDTFETAATQVLSVGFNLSKEAYGSTANIKPETYDLSTATGMTFWQNSIVLYGIAKDPTILFLSDVNNPGYFPYPNRIEIFDEPVIHAVPFLDKLLVFTATQLHLLTPGTDGTSWTKSTIQGNLDIKDWDIHLIQVVKNMVFFKSGNYFYMVVPKVTSITNGLTIAPISKLIEPLLDKFKENITEIVAYLYDYKDPLTLVHYYNFLDFEDVHNIYVFQTNRGVNLNVDLLYNTLDRTWRLHTYESQNILAPYKQDATRKGTLISVVKIDQRWKNGTTVSTGYLPGVQFHRFNEVDVRDFYIPSGTKLYPAVDALPASFDNPETKLEAIHFIKNYQFVDFGYRDHSTDYKKRYREFQLKFNNISQIRLQFLTEFSIDGDLRRTFYKYQMTQELDPANPRYGVIYLERVPILTDELPGTTTFGYDQDDVNAWTLDSSTFPETVLWKVRIPISGKGYAPRIRLISFNEELYELLNVAWIFRILYSR